MAGVGDGFDDGFALVGFGLVMGLVMGLVWFG